jgi:hypothetical protein
MFTPKTAFEIECQMRQVRRDLDDQVDELVDSARQITEQMSDWRSYVGAHPWIFLGAAAALGYLVVPTRISVGRPVAETLSELAENGAIKLNPPTRQQSLLDSAVDMGLRYATSTALQVGMNLLNVGLNRYMSSFLINQSSTPGTATSDRGART